MPPLRLPSATPAGYQGRVLLLLLRRRWQRALWWRPGRPCLQSCHHLEGVTRRRRREIDRHHRLLARASRSSRCCALAKGIKGAQSVDLLLARPTRAGWLPSRPGARRAIGRPAPKGRRGQLQGRRREVRRGSRGEGPEGECPSVLPAAAADRLQALELRATDPLSRGRMPGRRQQRGRHGGSPRAAGMADQQWRRCGGGGRRDVRRVAGPRRHYRWAHRDRAGRRGRVLWGRRRAGVRGRRQPAHDGPGRGRRDCLEVARRVVDHLPAGPRFRHGSLACRPAAESPSSRPQQAGWPERDTQ
jgi:hypothetical protein